MSRLCETDFSGDRLHPRKARHTPRPETPKHRLSDTIFRKPRQDRKWGKLRPELTFQERMSQNIFRRN
jgi:hypothetical protein